MREKELFEQQLHDELLPGLRLLGLIAIVGFVSCVPLDYLIYPEKLWDLLRVRGVGVGIALLVLGLSFLPWTQNRLVVRSLAYVNILNPGFGLAGLTYVAGGSTCPYWTVILVVFFGGVILQRFSILEAALNCLLINIFFCGLMLWLGEPIFSVSFIGSNVALFIGMLVAVVAAGYLRSLQIKEFNLRTSFAQASAENARVLEELSRSAWVKSHSADIATALQGVDSIPVFARQLMTRLTPLMAAQVGVFYYFDRKAQCFTLLGSHGYKMRKNFNQYFRMGEGIVGQCAVERAPIMLTELPPDYMHIASALGQASPRCVLAAPVAGPDGNMVAVVEMGLLTLPGARERALFDEVIKLIGVSISILENSQRAPHEIKP